MDESTGNSSDEEEEAELMEPHPPFRPGRIYVDKSDSHVFPDDNADYQFVMNPDDLDDYVTKQGVPDIMGDSPFELFDNTSENHECVIPTTNAGDMPYEIFDSTNQARGRYGTFSVSAHVLMNQCGTLLTRNKHQIKGSSKHQNLLQGLCATTIGTSIPLLQPEAMLFPSIFWKMVP